jgi:hypothetical protein
MVPIYELPNSLMDFEFGLGRKKSMFDERSEEFALFPPCFPNEKSISEFNE